MSLVVVIQILLSRITKRQAFSKIWELHEARIRKKDSKYIERDRFPCGHAAFQMCEKGRGKHNLQ